MKSITTINPAIMENTECSIVEACTSFINLKVGVLFDHGVSLSSVLFFSNMLGNVPSNNVRSTPASSALILVFASKP